jgi:hypothetical protein
MKITFLNIWGGTKQKEYVEFLKEKRSFEDVFCFQEMCSFHEERLSPKGATLHSWKLTQDILSNFIGFHAVRQRTWHDMHGISTPAPWGLGLLAQKDIPLLEYRETFLLGYHDSSQDTGAETGIPVVLQAIKVLYENKKLWILNIHGYYAGSGFGKHDTPERLLQSQGIIAFMHQLDGNIILGGDFNLNPDTESIKMLEDFGLRNLIKEYNIPSTRTSFYAEEKRKKWPHADYVFVSPGIKVKSFEVDTDSLVSDHAPMFLEIE